MTLCTVFGVLAGAAGGECRPVRRSSSQCRSAAHAGDRDPWLALGATGRNVLWLMLPTEPLALVLVGIAIGLPLAWLTQHAVARERPLWAESDGPGRNHDRDALLLILVSLIACWLPARRATKVDPMIAPVTSKPALLPDANYAFSVLALADSRDRRDRTATLCAPIGGRSGSRVALPRTTALKTGTGSTGDTSLICCGGAPAPSGMHYGCSLKDWRTKCFKTCVMGCECW